MITVRQLIEHLKRLPQDSVVLYECYSDYSTLDTDQIKVQSSTDQLRRGSAVAHHNIPGEFRRCDGPHEYGQASLPTPPDAVIFPGN